MRRNRAARLAGIAPAPEIGKKKAAPVKPAAKISPAKPKYGDLGYKELQALAKSKGVAAGGKAADIRARLEAADK